MTKVGGRILPALWAFCGTTLLITVVAVFIWPSASGASTVGVAKSSINLTYIYNDLSIITQEHLAPSDGNILGDVQDIVHYVNTHGGVNGRTIHLTWYRMPSITGSAASDQAACLAATEQDHAFVVYVGNAVDASVGQCTSVQHRTLTLLAGSSPPEQYFQQAEGRLFTIGSGVSMDADRQVRGWVDVMNRLGVLKGKRIGVIAQSTPVTAEGITNDLKPELAKLGYHVAAEATVPLPVGATECSQTSTAAQVMKQAGVNMVFLAAYDLCGVSVVEAARSLDYKPRWTTDSDNITFTVSKFFAPVKDWFDGAYGVGAAANSLSPDAEHCVDKEINPEEHYRTLSDAYGVAAQGCITFQQLTKALAQASSSLSTSSAIAALESQKVQPMAGGPSGTLGVHQHDAANYLEALQFSAAKGYFQRSSPIVVKVPCPCSP
jgi:hypothetical protein